MTDSPVPFSSTVETCWTGPWVKTQTLSIFRPGGSGPDNQISLNVVESTSTESMEIADADISTTLGALQAIDSFERASQTLNAAREQVGAIGNRLVSTANSLNI